jgi:hypothetical protein
MDIEINRKGKSERLASVANGIASVMQVRIDNLLSDLKAATKLNEHYLKLVQAQHEEIACLGERLKFWEDRGRACESNLEQLEQDFDNLEKKSGMATSFLG